MCSTELPRLRGAPFHLKQVLLNLLTNAIKYTDKGFVRVRVDTEPHSSEAATVCGNNSEKCESRDSIHPQKSQVPFEVDALMVRISVEDSGIGHAEIMFGT